MRWTFLLIFLVCVSCENKENNTLLQSDLTSKLYQESQNKNLTASDRIHKLKDIIVQSAENDTLKPYALYGIARIFYSLKAYDSIKYYGLPLLKGKKDKINLLNVGKYYHLLGSYHERNTDHIDSAFYYHDMARKTFTAINDSSRIFSRMVRLGYLQRFQGDYFGAKETLSSALEFKKANNSKQLANLYNELGTVHLELNNIDEALRFYELATNTTNIKKDQAIYKNNYGAALLELEKYGEAKTLFENIISDFKTEIDSINLARVLQHIGYATWKLGEDDALEKLNQAAWISSKIDDKNGLVFSYKRFGEFYKSTNSEKATAYLDSAIQLAKKLKRPRLETDALTTLMQIYPNTVSHRDRYIFLTDSLKTKELQVKTQFAYLKYQDQQEKEQLLRLQAETSKRGAELAKQQTQKIVSFALSSFLLCGGGFLFFIFKQRHKKEKLQEVYNTERRISKKVHDELANDIYGIMTRMEHAKTLPKEDTLNALEDIYQRTRDISHETGHIAIHDFQEELKSLLSQFRSDEVTIAVLGLSNIKWDNLSDETKITLYRVLNELMVNMKKHSGATTVSVRFEQLGKQLYLSYTDNGSGVQLPIKKGVGLANTETRINNSNGTFSFDSKPDEGVNIQCSFPI